MLKLTYNRKHDKFQKVTVLGDADGIQDLYWQLTKNYIGNDGTEIGAISISNLDGEDITSEIMIQPYNFSTSLSNLF